MICYRCKNWFKDADMDLVVVSKEQSEWICHECEEEFTKK